MKLHFPEDRSLRGEAAGIGEARITLSALSLQDPAPHVTTSLAVAVIFIFSRLLQVEELGVRVCSDEPETRPDYWVSTKIINTESIIESLASAKIRSENEFSLPEVNLLITSAASRSQTDSGKFYDNVLEYEVQGHQIHLKLSYQLKTLANNSAQDFLQKIANIFHVWNHQPDMQSEAVSLATASSAEIIPNFALPIVAKEFTSLPLKFLEVADQYAEQPAIIGNDIVYSYSDLKNQTAGLIAELRTAGICTGDVVAIAGASSFGTIASLLAVMSVGGIVVTIDSLLPVERRKLIADISQPKFQIDVGSGKIDSATTGVIATTDWPAPDQIRPTSEAPHISNLDNASAYIFFTSGSSGIPKGVLGSHLGLAHFLDWQRSNFPIGPGDRTAQLTALSFDVVLRDIFYPLTSGACVHIPRRETFMDARKMLQWMANTQITAMHCVPSLMRAWLLAETGAKSFKSLKYIFFAGEPLTDALLHRFKEASSELTQITNLYGPTETTLAKLSNRIQHVETGIQPVGRPQPGVDVTIMKNRQYFCGLWETGEIVIRTPYRSKGYFQNTELTQQAFQVNPLRSDDEDLLYFTGDLGRYRSDGKVEIFGRMDSQIKIRGVRIEPNEIESCILSFAGIKDAAVTTRASSHGDKILVAVVVSDVLDGLDSTVQTKMLRDFLKEKLHEAMVPARIICVPKIPYLPNGKLDRKSIGAWDLDAIDRKSEKPALMVQLSPKLERIISEIQNTLGIQVDDLSKSFVDLGGDSLSYIRVSLIIEDELGSLPPGWELTPLGQLDAQTTGDRSPDKSKWVTVETSIALRALAIFFVVLGHATPFQFIGTSTLFVISGMSFGKFFRRGLIETGNWRPVIRFILKFGIPAGLWQALAILTGAHAFWLPDLFLMGTYIRESTHPHYTLWYLDVLAANVLIISAISIFYGKLFKSKGPGFSIDFVLVLIGLLISFLQVGTNWWNGTLGLTSVAPFKWFWMLALGVAIAQAQTVKEKSVVSVLLAVIGLATLVELPKIAGSFAQLDGFFFIAVSALIWLDRINIPRFSRRPVIAMASASLFIYIVNNTVIQQSRKLLKFEGSWPIEIVLAIVVGILCSWIWNKLESLLMKTRQGARSEVVAS